jgi:hypothetical protein
MKRRQSGTTQDPLSLLELLSELRLAARRRQNRFEAHERGQPEVLRQSRRYGSGCLQRPRDVFRRYRIVWQYCRGVYHEHEAAEHGDVTKWQFEIARFVGIALGSCGPRCKKVGFYKL